MENVKIKRHRRDFFPLSNDILRGRLRLAQAKLANEDEFAQRCQRLAN